MQPGNFRLTILIFPWDDSGASQAFARPDKLVQIANPGRSSLCEHWNCGLGCRSRPLTGSVTGSGQIPIPVTHGYRFPRFCQNSSRAKFDSLVQFDSSFLKKRSKDSVLTRGARHFRQVPQPVTLESLRSGCTLLYESPGVPYSLGSLEGHV